MDFREHLAKWETSERRDAALRGTTTEKVVVDSVFINLEGIVVGVRSDGGWQGRRSGADVREVSLYWDPITVEAVEGAWGLYVAAEELERIQQHVYNVLQSIAARMDGDNSPAAAVSRLR